MFSRCFRWGMKLRRDHLSLEKTVLLGTSIDFCDVLMKDL